MLFVGGFGLFVRFPIGLNTPGGSLIILTGPLVLFVGVPELVLFCPPGINCVNPGRPLLLPGLVGSVILPSRAKLTKPGRFLSLYYSVLLHLKVVSCLAQDLTTIMQDLTTIVGESVLLLLLDEVWFDGIEAFPFELWWDVFAYAAGALLSTDPIKKSVITTAVSIIVCFFILIIFLNFKLNNSSIEVKPVYRYKSSGRYIRKTRPG